MLHNAQYNSDGSDDESEDEDTTPADTFYE